MLKAAVLVSGGGTNLQAILDAVETGRIRNAKIVSVISNNPKAYALERAKKHGVPAVCVSRKECGSKEAFDEALLKAIQDSGADLVVLAGCSSVDLMAPIEDRSTAAPARVWISPGTAARKRFSSVSRTFEALTDA